MPPTRSILVCGATGLVGSAALVRLLRDPAFGRVVALTRRPLPVPLRAADSAGRMEEQVVDFERLAERPELFRADQVLCAPGTTIRKAGSRDAFRRVDHDHALEVARLGLREGARHFLLVSALGADPRSRISYSREASSRRPCSSSDTRA